MTLGDLVPINLFVDVSKLIGERYPGTQMRNGPGGSHEFILTPEEDQ